MKIVYKCMNDSSHVFKGRIGSLEGVTCPVCDSHVLPVRSDEEKDNSIPDYYALMKKYRKKIIRCVCLLFKIWKEDKGL